MSDIKSRLERIFKTILAYNGEMNDNCSMESIDGWDSLSHIEFLLHLEKCLSIQFSSTEIDRTTQYIELEKLVGEKSL